MESMSSAGLCVSRTVFSRLSGWHDAIVDCHSCLAKPAKGVWLNSHSFPKETWSHLETYKPYGQVNKLSLKWVLLDLGEENDNGKRMPLCAARTYRKKCFLLIPHKSLITQRKKVIWKSLKSSFSDFSDALLPPEKSLLMFHFFFATANVIKLLFLIVWTHHRIT